MIPAKYGDLKIVPAKDVHVSTSKMSLSYDSSKKMLKITVSLAPAIPLSSPFLHYVIATIIPHVRL